MTSGRLAARRLRIAVVMGLLAMVTAGRGAPDPVSIVEPARPGTVDDRAPRASGELLIKYRPGIGSAGRRAVREDLGATEVSVLRPRLERVRLPDRSIDDVLERYAVHPLVEYVEPNYLLTAQDGPIDPFFADQWSLENTGQLSGMPGADIGARAAWAATTGSHEVVVAVLDSGIDPQLADLAPNLWRNPDEIPGNGIDDDGNGLVDDDRGWDFVNGDNDPGDDAGGHGTFVAGIIGAVGDNAFGTTGVAWKVTLMPVKMLDGTGNGTVAEAVAGLEYCLGHQVDVVNASWGGTVFSRALLEAIDALAEEDIAFVTASGNQGRDIDERPHFPGSYESAHILVVAATDRRDELAAFSNYGRLAVDLAAPGAQVLSSLPNGFYEARSGTSYAAPHVTGAVALLRSLAPNMSVAEIKRRLMESAQVRPTLEGLTVSGGRLHAGGALEDADTQSPAPIDDLRVVDVTSDTARLVWTATGDDGYRGTAARYDVRVAATPVDAGSFDTAAPRSGAPRPAPAGSGESFTVQGLQPGRGYSFAIRVEDEWGNRSPVGNSPSVTTLPAPVVETSPPSLQLELLSGRLERRALSLFNRGGGPLDWSAEPHAGSAGWLTATPSSGRLLPGATAVVELEIDAGGLPAGDYTGALTIESNDPQRPSLDHPVGLAVIDAPAIEVEPVAIDFGSIVVGSRGQASFLIRNPGSLALLAELSAGPELALDVSGVTVAAGESRAVTAVWSPATEGTVSGLIELMTNLEDSPRLRVPWVGEALPAPAIDVAPRAVEVELATGQQARRTLRIDNAGRGTLVALLRFVPEGVGAEDEERSGGAAAPPVFVNGGFETGDFTGWVAESNDLPQLTPWTVGERFDGFFGTVAPLEGEFAAFNGFDGAAGLTYRMYQDIRLPEDVALATLAFNDRLQYDGLGIAAQHLRVYEADLLDERGALLAPIVRESFVPGDAGYRDTGWRRRELDITPWIGRPVRVEMRQLIPESFTGPSSIEFDDYRIDTIAYPDWMQPTTPKLVVPPGTAVELPLDFEAGSRGTTTLRGTLRVETNVPGIPRVPVSLTLRVTAAPDLGPLPAELDLGEVPRGGTARRELTVRNRGAERLQVEAAATAPFGVEPPVLEILPGGEDRLSVSFDAAEEGVASGILRLSTNDPDTPEPTVNLTGRGVPPPAIEVDPLAIDAVVAAGESLVVPLWIRNTGPGVLDASLVAAAEWVELHPAGLALASGGAAEVHVLFDATMLVPGRHESVARVLSNDPQNPEISLPLTLEVRGLPRLEIIDAVARFTTSRSYASPGAVTVHGLQLPTMPPAGDPRLTVIAEGDYGADDEVATPGIGGLLLEPLGGAGEDCTAVTRSYVLPPESVFDPARPGRAEVVVTAAPPVGPICDVNRHRVSLDYPVSADPLDWGDVPLGRTYDRILRLANTGTGSLVAAMETTPEFVVAPAELWLAPGESREVSLSWTPRSEGTSTGSLLIAVDDPASPLTRVDLRGRGVRASIELQPAQLDVTVPTGGAARAGVTVTSGAALPLDVRVEALGNAAAAVSPAPAQFTLPPGGQRDIELTLDAASLLPGEETVEIRFTTGDAGAVETAVVSLVVSPAPDVALHAFAVAESRIDFSGDRRTYHALPFFSPPIGDAILKVVLEGDFGAVGESAFLSLEGSTVTRIEFVGNDCTPQSVSPTVKRADLEQLGADGVIEVSITNSDAVDDSCAVNRHQVELSYPVDPGRLEFGEVIPGGQRRYRVWLRNDGVRTLNISALGIDGSGFVMGPGPLQVAPGARRSLDVAFAPVEVGDHEAVWFVETDDPDEPRLEIQLHGAAPPPPAASLSPMSADVLLAPGEMVERTFTLSNAGEGPLAFSLELLPADPGFGDPVPGGGSVPAGGSAEIVIPFFGDATPGGHQSELYVATSDPEAPILRVPLSMAIVGPPVLTVPGVRRIAESAVEFFSAAATTRHQLSVDHAFAGEARLEVRARGDYGGSTEKGVVSVEGVELGQFGANGFDCSTVRFGAELPADQLAAFAADGVVEVEIVNAESVNPICSQNLHQVRLIYREPPDSIAFGETFTGQVAGLGLILRNDGASVLSVEAELVGDAVFSSAPAVMVVAPGAEREVAISFSPEVPGEYTAELIVRSNDSGSPERRFPVSGQAAHPPRAVFAQGTIVIDAAQGGQGTHPFPVTNMGGAALTLAVREAPGEPGRLLSLAEDPRVLLPEETAALDLGFDTRRRAPGDYGTTLRVETNDPDRRVVDLPVVLRVGAAPDLFLAGRRVRLESVRDFSEAGEQTRAILELSEPPVGDVGVTLTAFGDFAAFNETATLAIGGVVLGSVGDADADCRSVSRDFTVRLEDVPAVFPDRIADIQVINASSVSPFCFLNRHQVVISYDGPAPDLDFGAVFVGSSGEQTLRIANRGALALHVERAIASSPEVEVPAGPWTVSPGETLPLSLTYVPRLPGELAAVLRIESDDPDEPAVEIALAGSAVAPPRLTVDPAAVRMVVAPDEATQARVRLANRGGSPLVWGASWVDIGDLDNPDYVLRDGGLPAGPAFDWWQIVGEDSGLRGDDEISAPIELGFSFPFYGKRFESVRISTDGWISFGAARPSFRNAAELPDDGFASPPNLVAPFWDDLVVGSGSIRYERVSDGFIVLYEGVSRFTDPAQLTFQAHLYDTGRIVFRYLQMNGRIDSATIGIQNGARDRGLTVSSGAPYAVNGTAAELTPAPPWAQAAPMGGVLAPGGTISVELAFSPLFPWSPSVRSREADLVIHGNDPATPAVNVPVRIDVAPLAIEGRQPRPLSLR